ncbi:hypothetical protein Mal48_05240 [Thalassoglobus polymorphus]|uniref:Uncharacterized protein n=1 Tax=Thalassoglobus polymorphus TaxID=2527994 RepID=A0A517QI27_9PLAN|nr:hypothetical protein Mal48_05240 [Thalassoglobus polymorphus]
MHESAICQEMFHDFIPPFGLEQFGLPCARIEHVLPAKLLFAPGRT